MRSISWEKVMNAVKDGILTADVDSRILMLNQEVCRIWGYEEKELLHQKLTMLMPESYRQRHLNGMDRHRDGRGIPSRILGSNIIMEGQRKNGEIFPIEINIARFEFQGKKMFTAAVRDITERIKFENELKQSREELQARTDALEQTQAELQRTVAELQESNQELERFAYIASHDLQEPLRTVEGYVGLIKKRVMKKEELAEDNALLDFAQQAVFGVKRMQSLIRDLLEYSKIGRGSKNLEELKLEILLEVIRYNLRESLRESNAEIRFSGNYDFVADRTQMIQLFQNLIANSIKFRHPDRQPVIEIIVEDLEEESRFTVKDNGVGIDPEYKDLIFVIFQRLERDHSIQGTGIGLAICKKIVEQHGGQITLESQPGQGAAFSFSLKKATIELQTSLQ